MLQKLDIQPEEWERQSGGSHGRKWKWNDNGRQSDFYFSYFNRNYVVKTQQIPSNNCTPDTLLVRESTLLL